MASNPSMADELAIINAPLNDVDLVMHMLNGLGVEYKEVSAALRTCENPITFKELHDILLDFENYLKRDNSNTDLQVPATAHAAYKGKQPYSKKSSSGSFSTSGRSNSPNSSRRIICQYCEKPGHTAKVCYKIHGYPKKPTPSAHHSRNVTQSEASDWIMDSGATHHITNDFENLHLTTPYVT